MAWSCMAGWARSKSTSMLDCLRYYSFKFVHLVTLFADLFVKLIWFGVDGLPLKVLIAYPISAKLFIKSTVFLYNGD